MFYSVKILFKSCTRFVKILDSNEKVYIYNITLSDWIMSRIYFSLLSDPLWVCLFVWVEALRPSQQFFSHVETEPPLSGYYQYFLGGKCILLKGTTWQPE